MSPSTERWAEGPALLTSVWRYRWLVLAATLVTGATGYFFSQGQPEVYQASSTLHLANPESTGVFGQGPRTNLERYLPQQAERAMSTQVLAAAADILDDGTTAADLADDVDVTAMADLSVLRVTARGGTAERAARLANVVADAYQRSVRESTTERATRAIEELERAADEVEEQIADLDAQAGAGGGDQPGGNLSGQVEVLVRRLTEIDTLSQQLLVDARLFGSGVDFVEAAEPPERRIEPTPRRTAAAAGVLGALLASALAYWLAGRGQKIENQNEPGQILGVPLLGALPIYAVKQQGTLRERTTLDPRTTEAYRFVYSSLESTLRGMGASSVLITSAGPSTGKTETSLQVATTMRRRGQNVLLIDADLRMRGLTTFLRADRTPGLQDLSKRTDADPNDIVGHYRLDDERNLSIVTAGVITADAEEHLSESWFGHAFERLVQAHTMTIVDSPPLLAVADTAMIAGYTDAIVLVVREGTDVAELERVIDRLRFVGQRLVGYIYLSPSALDNTAFDYGLVRSKIWDTTKSGAGAQPPRSPVPSDRRTPSLDQPSRGPAQTAKQSPRDGASPSNGGRSTAAPPQESGEQVPTWWVPSHEAGTGADDPRD